MGALFSLSRASFHTRDRDSDVSPAVFVWDLHTVTLWELGVWVMMLGGGRGNSASCSLRPPTPLGPSYSPAFCVPTS